MAGGIIQLVAYGAQDIYLTGNPQITFFKAVYKRHTNFAIEKYNQYGVGTINWGNKLTYNIDRKGDLLGKCHLDFYLEFIDSNGNNLSFDQIKQQLITNRNNNNLAKSIGYSFINYIDIEIGGNTIDTHTGHWMAIKSELSKDFNSRINDFFLTGGFYRASHISDNAIYISIPLQFWFNNNPGLYLPLVALQYHEVKINVKLNNLNQIIINNINGLDTPEYPKPVNIKIIELNLVSEYIYLDTEERKKFAQVSHEYLIEQLQELPNEFCNTSNNIALLNLGFNHPIKEIIWTLHRNENTDLLGPLWSGEKDRIKTAQIQLNGTDRFPLTPGIYFQSNQKLNHHSGIDLHKFFLDITGIITGSFVPYNDNLESKFPNADLSPFIYSFSMEPEKYQPSGSCNFSRLDNAILTFTINQKIPKEYSDGILIKVYGTNYNVLRIMSGMGGLAYSN